MCVYLFQYLVGTVFYIEISLFVFQCLVQHLVIRVEGVHVLLDGSKFCHDVCM